MQLLAGSCILCHALLSRIFRSIFHLFLNLSNWNAVLYHSNSLKPRLFQGFTFLTGYKELITSSRHVLEAQNYSIFAKGEITLSASILLVSDLTDRIISGPLLLLFESYRGFRYNHMVGSIFLWDIPIHIVLKVRGRREATPLCMRYHAVILIRFLYLLLCWSWKAVPGWCLGLILSIILVPENQILLMNPLSLFLVGGWNWNKSFISLTCFAYWRIPTFWVFWMSFFMYLRFSLNTLQRFLKI